MSAPEEEGEEARLLGRAKRVDTILEELSTMVSPLAHARVEELVSSLIDLYGAGLSRLLTMTRALDGSGDLDARLEQDLLLASLLSLHGLGPLPPPPPPQEHPEKLVPVSRLVEGKRA